jgi:hypothetical protein
MLEAGRELALAAGAALTIEHLRLEEVIQRARVPRSSVYRMWSYREDYIDDLLCYLAGEGSWFSERPVLDPGTFGVVRQLIADNSALLATLEGRRALLCEVVRVTVTGNYALLTGSTQWRLHMALVATLGSTRSGQARRRIAAALEDAQRRSRDWLVTILAHIADALGLRLRNPAYTLDHVQLAGGLVIQSLALRNVQIRATLGGDGAETEAARGDEHSGDKQNSAEQSSAEQSSAEQSSGGEAEQSGAERSGAEQSGAGELSAAAGVPDAEDVDRLLNGPIPGPGLHGEPARWTLVAHAYLGVLDSFMELDPDFTPPPAAEPD